MTRASANRRVRQSKFLRDHPEVNDELLAGRISGRRVHLSRVGDIWRLDGELTAEAGSIIAQRLKEIEDELFVADHTDAKARYGDKTTLADLDRDPAQRRHDALVELAYPTKERTAAQRPLIQAIGDTQTLAEGVAKLIDLSRFYPEPGNASDPSGDDDIDAAPHTDGDADEPNRHEADGLGTGERPVMNVGTGRIRDFHPDSGRIPPICELEDGTPISARRLAELALGGHIQHFLFDGPHTVLAVGNRQRLFTGKIREALILRDRTCTEPGCAVRGRDCHAHHIVAHEDGGPTSEANGEMRCGFHHRYKCL